MYEVHLSTLANEHDATVYDRLSVTDAGLALTDAGLALADDTDAWTATPHGEGRDLVGGHARRRPPGPRPRTWPVADRIGAVVVAACTRTVRGVRSELYLGPGGGMSEPCVASFDALHRPRRARFRRRITRLTRRSGPKRAFPAGTICAGGRGDGRARAGGHRPRVVDRAASLRGEAAEGEGVDPAPTGHRPAVRPDDFGVVGAGAARPEVGGWTAVVD